MSNVTMKDIAKRAGVSQPLVSLIMNNSKLKVSEASREKVQRIAREMNYTPNQAARSLKTGKTRIIGITSGTGIPVRQVFNTPYFSSLYSGIGDAAADNGYRILLQQDGGAENGNASLEMLTAQMVDGVIFVLLSEYIDDFLENQLPRLRQLKVPYRIIANVGGVEGTTITGVDSRLAAEKATGHLLGHGYKDIGFLYYKRGDNRFIRDVENGFNAAVRQAGLAETNTVRLISDRICAEDGYRVVDEWLRTGQSFPRALFSSNVQLAHGAMLRIKEAGIRIPEDCAIAAYGLDTSDVFLFSGLTTVTLPAAEMGRAAAKSLLHAMAGSEDATMILDPVLQIRKSCGCTDIPHANV